MAELGRSIRLQDGIWRTAAAASSAERRRTAILLPALNDMISIASKRTLATTIHPPVAIPIMLGALAPAGALLAGYGMAGRGVLSGMHVFLFAAVMVVTVYVTVDLEYPRLGLIRVDDADQPLVDLPRGME